MRTPRSVAANGARERRMKTPTKDDSGACSTKARPLNKMDCSKLLQKKLPDGTAAG